MEEVQDLTTWDIPIGAIIVTDDREFKYEKVKRERRPRIGVCNIQYFISQDSDKKKMCFIYGVKVVLLEDGKYRIKSEIKK